MIDQILAIVNLGEKLPEAVGWQFFGPYELSLPEEFLAKIRDEETNIDGRISGSGLIIYNYSGSSKTEIRVLYSGDFEFSPKVSYGRRNATVKWYHDEENKEFIIYDIPSDETIEIELFNIYRGFCVDQVMVEGKLITKFMNKRALAKAHSDLTSKLISISLPILCAMAITIAGYACYIAYKQSQDSKLISAAFTGFAGCTLSVYDNPPGIESKERLARKIKKMEPWMKAILLEKNNVSSEADLFDLDQVIICTPGPV